jgi:uridine kinase
MGIYSSNCKIIAIAGPTASGKTTFAYVLRSKLGNNKAVIIGQDNYYKNWSYLSKKTRKKINFDDIKAFDFNLLTKHLLCLKRGKAIKSPLYNFAQSRRLKKTIKIIPKPYIIVEGLMPFYFKRLARLFDYKIYIEANKATCLARRIKRDIKERGESIESVCSRYFNDVLLKQKKYVEPQKRWADEVVNWDKIGIWQLKDTII